MTLIIPVVVLTSLSFMFVALRVYTRAFLIRLVGADDCESDPFAVP
jgi:hypothetical protein